MRKAAKVRDQTARLRVVVTDGLGIPIRSAGLARWLARVAPARARGTVTIALVSDRQIRSLNRTYRHIDRATDVLSFPAETTHHSLECFGSRTTLVASAFSRSGRRAWNCDDCADARRKIFRLKPEATKNLGDVAISLDTARRQADERGHSLQTELRVLALHGLLHLLGYDHERDRGEMARLERRLRRRGGLTRGLTERR